MTNTNSATSSATIDHRRQLDRLLVELIELSNAERERRLGEIEGPALRKEVQELLAAALEPEGFLRPAGAVSEGLAHEVLGTATDRSGERIGPYRLARRIGEGGMGVVYLAERVDGQFERQVALKVVRVDSATRDRDRFAREQNILASLVHPGIARLYDGGLTDEGQPFFAMEYIDGKNIVQACNDGGFDTKQRVELLIEVCAAVEAAHRQLVVHRDLKPSNILVDIHGQVKLLDFGIAKLTESTVTQDTETEATGPPTRDLAGGAEEDRHRAEPPSQATGTLSGARLTLQYASPEQIRGRATSTASDVYQLGLLAYELIARERPYELGDLSVAAARRLVLQSEPEPPSRASAQDTSTGSRWRAKIPADDLDAVVLKALAKTPAERYTSAERMRDDLARCLDGRPVSSHKSQRSYSLRCFVGRHRLGVAIGALTTLLLASLSAGFTWRLAREQAATQSQADRAEQANREAQQVVVFLTELFDVDPVRSGKGNITTKEILDRGATRLRSDLSEQPALRARMLTLVGDVYRRQGQFEASRALLTEGLELRRQIYGEHAPELASSWHRLGVLAKDRGNLAEADEFLSKANGGDVGPSLLTDLGNLRLDQGRPEDAVVLFEQVLANSTTEDQLVSTVNLTNALVDAGRPEEATVLLEAAISDSGTRLGREHPIVGIAFSNLATSYADRGDAELAIPLFLRSLALLEETLDPADLRLAQLSTNLGNALTQLERFEEAREHFMKALDLYRAVANDHPDAATILGNLGAVEWKLGRPAEAERIYRQVLTAYERRLPKQHPQVALTLFNLGEALLEQAKVQAAEEALMKSRDMFLATLGEEHPLASWPMLYLARIRTDQGRIAEARTLLLRAKRLREATAGLDPADVKEAVDALAQFEALHPLPSTPIN